MADPGRLIDATLRYAVALSHGHFELNVTLWQLELHRTAHEQRVSLAGRWCRTPVGFIGISADGSAGRYAPELPPDVDPAAVFEPPPLEVVPGRRRLGDLVAELEAAAIPPELQQPAQQVRQLASNAWDGAEPGRGEGVYAAFRGAIAEAAADGEDVTGALARHLGALWQLYAELSLDSSLVSLAATAKAVADAVAAQHGAAPAREVVAAAFGGTGGDPVNALVQHVWHAGGAPALEAAAGTLREHGDTGLEAALDTQGYPAFLLGLHAVVPWSLGSYRLWHFLAGRDQAPADAARRRRAKAGADEHHTRISNAVQHGVRSIETPIWEAHRGEIGRLLREQGRAAAQRRAAELVEVHFLYPRSMQAGLTNQEQAHG